MPLSGIKTEETQSPKLIIHNQKICTRVYETILNFQKSPILSSQYITKRKVNVTFLMVPLCKNNTTYSTIRKQKGNKELKKSQFFKL